MSQTNFRQLTLVLLSGSGVAMLCAALPEVLAARF